MKEFVRKHLPILIPVALIPEYVHDYCRFIKYSGIMGEGKNKTKITGKIISQYHAIEKGLTMPETRLGFGKIYLIPLIDNCLLFSRIFGLPEPQIEHAISVVLEYKEYHKRHNYELNPIISQKIEELENSIKNINHSKQFEFSGTNYFKDRNSPFPEFASSRRSIRNYSDEEIPMEVMKDAVSMARSTPSACNRQTCRVYVFSDKNKIEPILKIQGGSGGFGHLSNKLIVITFEAGVFHGVYERNQGYVDGGMFAMNLLYALHYHKIVACSLNCSISIQKDKKLRELCGIKKSEIFVVMISCGYVPERFMSAFSARYPVEEILTIK